MNRSPIVPLARAAIAGMARPAGRYPRGQSRKEKVMKEGESDLAPKLLDLDGWRDLHGYEGDVRTDTRMFLEYQLYAAIYRHNRTRNSLSREAGDERWLADQQQDIRMFRIVLAAIYKREKLIRK
jgi:hypothetical protein